MKGFLRRFFFKIFFEYKSAFNFHILLTTRHKNYFNLLLLRRLYAGFLKSSIWTLFFLIAFSQDFHAHISMADRFLVNRKTGRDNRNSYGIFSVSSYARPKICFGFRRYGLGNKCHSFVPFVHFQNPHITLYLREYLLQPSMLMFSRADSWLPSWRLSLRGFHLTPRRSPTRITALSIMVLDILEI